LGSMARRAWVAANARGKGSGSSRDLANATGSAVSVERPLHQGDDPPMVEVGENNSRSQPAAPPAPLAQPRANPAAPDAGAGTPRDTRRGPSPGGPCRCRGRPGSALRR
jgi:hypothetical protein